MRNIFLSVCSAIIPGFIVLLFLGFQGEASESAHNSEQEMGHSAGYVIVIHGGAGTLTTENTPPAIQEAYLSSLRSALETGSGILDAGGSALDAVETVIRHLEDDSLFNAGKGAVLNAAGQPELDASIMDGSSMNAGAVAGVSHIRNPISAARAVMEKSGHVLLAGHGAEFFAISAGLDTVSPEYFKTHRALGRYGEMKAAADKHGTVGCVVLDANGNLAAGTSTGGMMMKRYGRIGDSPIIGAGTWADNRTCGISSTGHGEYFIRNAVAHEISALMMHGGLSLDAAADSVVMGVLKRQEGLGGIIAVDHNGNFHFSFNTTSMLRGVLVEGGQPDVHIFREESAAVSH